MAESNKLDEPLSETEYDALEAFFGSNAVPQDCMDLEMLDGFLTAIVSGPELNHERVPRFHLHSISGRNGMRSQAAGRNRRANSGGN